MNEQTSGGVLTLLTTYLKLTAWSAWLLTTGAALHSALFEKDYEATVSILVLVFAIGPAVLALVRLGWRAWRGYGEDVPKA